MFDSLITTDTREKILAALPTAADSSIQEAYDFFTSDDSHGGEAFAKALMNLKFSDIHEALSAKPKKGRSKSKVPSVENWKDETVQAEYRAAVAGLIAKTGLGDARGLAPIQIRKSLGRGSEQQLREVLQALESDGVVAFTGKTRGKCYVPAAMLEEAEEVLEAEIAQREKEEAEREARKAAKEAEAAS